MSITAFIRKNLRPDTTPHAAEARRLMVMLTKAGIKTTLPTVLTTARKIRGKTVGNQPAPTARRAVWAKSEMLRLARIGAQQRVTDLEAELERLKMFLGREV